MLSTKNYAALIKRLHQEKKDLQNTEFSGFSIAPEEKDIFTWNGVIFGPDDSYYSGGIFRIKIILTADYPMEPPKCEFLTQIYHPNIFPESKYICLNILEKHNWRPTMTIEKLLISIHSLLANPNFDHVIVDSKTGKPLYHEPTQKGLEAIEEFRKTAREWVNRYAQ